MAYRITKAELKQGDIVSVDIGAFFEGFHGDNARTFPCGDISEERAAAYEGTREESLYEGIAQAKAGNRIGDIGSAVQRYVEARGYSVVRDFVGHGVGAKLHEEPKRTQLRHTRKRCAPVTGNDDRHRADGERRQSQGKSTVRTVGRL